MNVRQFIDPIEEEDMEQSDDILEAFISRFQPESERERDNDEEVDEEVSLVPDSEALKAIQVLRLYKE